jgi:hypothetical protein
MRKGIHGVYTVKIRIQRYMPRWLSTVDTLVFFLSPLILFLFCFTFSLSQCCFFSSCICDDFSIFLFFSISSVSCCSFLGDCQSSSCFFLVIFYSFLRIIFEIFVNFLVIFEILSLKDVKTASFCDWLRNDKGMKVYNWIYFLKFWAFWFHNI